MFGLSKTDRIRRRLLKRKARIREQTTEIESDIDNNCPLLQCVMCDCEFDGVKGSMCPKCGSNATLKHVLRRSARL